MKVIVRRAIIFAFFCVSLSCAQPVYASGIGDLPHYNRDNANVWWFLHASDTHIMKPSTDFLNAQKFKQFLESNANLIHPDFVVITGDMVQAGTIGLFAQEREEWQTYFDIVDSKGWNDRERLFDIPGNHDRYQNPYWLYYKFPNPSVYSVAGENSFPPGQFYKDIHKSFGDYQIIAANTCDRDGAAWTPGHNCGIGGDEYSCVSDFPELEPEELQQIADRLEGRGPSTKMSLVFGHASIFTEPGVIGWSAGGRFAHLVGLDITRTAASFVEILNRFGVMAYGYGHTHRSGIYRDIGHSVESLLVNAASLAGGSYRIWAIDDDQVATVDANISLEAWPKVVVTAPGNAFVHMDYLPIRTYSQTMLEIPRFSLVNPVRALVFRSSSTTGSETVEFSIDGSNVWNPMYHVRGELWEAEYDATKVTASIPGLGIDEHQLVVRSGNSTGTINFKISDSPAGQIYPPKDIVIRPGNGKAIIEWSKPEQNTSSEILGYQIYKKDDETGRYLPLLDRDRDGVKGEIPDDVLSADQLSYTVEGLNNGQLYYFYISTISQKLNESGPDVWRFVKPDGTAPPTVSNVSATAEPGAVTVCWQGPTNSDGTPISDLAGYRILRGEKRFNPAAPNWKNDFLPPSPEANLVDPTKTCFRDATAENGKQYFYVIMAVDVAGNESPGVETYPPLDIELVIDRSGSMALYERANAVASAAKLFVDVMKEENNGRTNKDRIGIITFGERSEIRHSIEDPQEAGRIKTTLDAPAKTNAKNGPFIHKPTPSEAQLMSEACWP